MLSDDRLLSWGEWWVRHEDTVRLSTRRLFWFVNCSITFLVVVGLIQFGIVEIQRQSVIQSELSAQLARTTDTTSFVPLAISTGPTRVFYHNGKADFVNVVKNPNTRYWLTLSYRFLSEGVTTPWKTTSVFPGSERPLIDVGVASAVRPLSATLELQDVAYHRLSPHVALDGTSWTDTQAGVIAVTQLSIGSGSPALASVEIRNTTPYNFRTVPLAVMLERGSEIVGIANVVASNVRSDERRRLEFVWPGDVPVFLTSTVTPLIEVNDQLNHLPF